MRNSLKKNLGILLAFIMLTASFAACSGENDNGEKKGSASKSDSIKDNEKDSDAIPATTITDAMILADGSIPEMMNASSDDENGEDLFAYLADFDYDKIAQYSFSYASEGTAEEIAVIELKDSDDVKNCESAVKDHVEYRIAQFETYDPTQVPRCEEAVVFTEDSYVVLIICDNADDVKQAFYDVVE